MAEFWKRTLKLLRKATFSRETSQYMDATHADDVRRAIYRRNGWDISRAHTRDIVPLTIPEKIRLLVIFGLFAAGALWMNVSVGVDLTILLGICFVYGFLWCANILYGKCTDGRAKREFATTVRSYLADGFVSSPISELRQLLFAHNYYLGSDPLLAATLVDLLPRVTLENAPPLRQIDIKQLAHTLTMADMPELRVAALHAIEVVGDGSCLPSVQAIAHEGVSSNMPSQVVELAAHVVRVLEERVETTKRHELLLRPAEVIDTSHALPRPACLGASVADSALLRPMERS